MKLSKKIQIIGKTAGITMVTVGTTITNVAIAPVVATVMATSIAASIAAQGIFSLAAKTGRHNGRDIHNASTDSALKPTA